METQTNQKITAQLAVDILNQALSLDPDCIAAEPGGFFIPEK
ncbi:hypothetical protein [Yersinia enterocolitica]|nr:hypothetical protein [Yersinia enterocolitica]